MSNSGLSGDINNYINTPATYSPSSIEPTTAPQTDAYYDGVSTIEESKTKANPFAFLSSNPHLPPPQQTSFHDFNVLVNLIETGKGSVVTDYIRYKESQISNKVVESWLKNVLEVAEQTKKEYEKYINSPYYLDLIAKQNQTGNASNQAILAQGAINNSFPAPSINYLDRVRDIVESELKSDSVNASKTEKTTAMSAVGLVSLGGLLAIGLVQTSIAVGASNLIAPIANAVQIIAPLQTAAPALIQNMVLTINLLITAPLYYAAFDAIKNGASTNGQKNDQLAALNFGKRILAMIADPNNSINSEQKLVLSSLALALLYSADVGKIAGGRFLGMEPQEFRDLLTGKLAIGSGKKDDPSLSESDQLKLRLLSILREELDQVEPEKKASLLAGLLDYFGETREMDSFLSPIRTMHEVFQTTAETQAAFLASNKG